MNTPLQFPTIDDKTIYQMSLNPGTSAGTYVTEPNAVLTNQILEILNPTSNEIDKARMFTDLMAPHYQKQDEIIEKIDKLANIVTSFIETQKSINEFILDRLLKSVNNATSGAQNETHQNFLEAKQSSFDLLSLPAEIIQQEKETRIAEESLQVVPSTSNITENENVKMSVRDFLKTNPPLMKRDSEQSCDEDNNDEQLIDETIRKYNKFRVRNPPKKYKRNPANSSSSTNSTSNIDPKPVENIIDPPQIPTTSNPEHSQHIVMPSVQRFDLMQTQNIYCPQTSFIVQNQTSQGIPDLKYHLDNPESNWKAVETSSTSSSSFMDHQHSNFLPFMSSEPHSRSAFVPAYHKERR